MQDADVLLHVLERVTATVIEQAPRLRLIQKLGVGVDTIDLDAARARGIAVCNMPGANTRAVAELTLLLMLATLRRLSDLDRQTRAGNGWALDSELLDNLGELGGRTVGLIGFGAVGKCLTPMLQGIGATRHLYVAHGDARRLRDIRDASRAACGRRCGLAARSAEPGDGGMIDEPAIETMKRGAILVNTARGGLVDYDALHRALASGRLRGAGLDVFESEPANAAHPLFQLPNVSSRRTSRGSRLRRCRGASAFFRRTAGGCATEKSFFIESCERAEAIRETRLAVWCYKDPHTHYTLSLALPIPP